MSEKKRYLNIPGSDTFLHTLKFDLSPPLEPLPYGKLLYYPLDNERYTRPKVTSLNLKEIGKIFTKCDLGMPVDEINLKFYQFNPQGQQCELDKEDQILIDEIDLEQEQTQKEQIEEDERIMQEILLKQKEDLAGISDMVKAERPHTESFSKGRSTKISESALPQYIESTFKDAEKYKIGMAHPNKEGVISKRVYDIVPQFEYLFEKFIAVNDGPGEKALPSGKDEIYLFQKEEDIDKQEILKLFRFGNARKESVYQLKEKEEEEYFDPTKINEVYDPLKMDVEENEEQGLAAFDPDQEENQEEKQQPVEITKIRLQKVQKQEEQQVEEVGLKKLENRQKYWFEHKDNFKISSNEIGGKQDFLLNFDQNKILFLKMEGNLILRKKMYGMNRPNDWNKRIKLVLMQSQKEDLEEKMKKYRQIGYKNKVLELQDQIKNYKQEFFVDSEKEDEEIADQSEEEYNLQQQADADFIQDSQEEEDEEEKNQDYFEAFHDTNLKEEDDEEYIKDDEQFFNLQKTTNQKDQQRQSFEESSGSLFKEEDDLEDINNQNQQQN